MKIENPVTLNEILAAARKAIELGQDSKYVAEKSRAEKVMLAHCKPATINDYKEWLKGYLSEGSLPTHFFNFPFEAVSEKFFLGVEDFEMVPLHGSNSVDIIVPRGITVLGNDTGHSSFYFEEGFRTLGFQGRPAPVPIYSDISF